MSEATEQMEEIFQIIKDIGTHTMHQWDNMADAERDMHSAVFWERKASAMQKMAWNAGEKAQALLEKLREEEWHKPADKLPEKTSTSYQQYDCLVVYKGEVRHLVWNCEHLCWDDSSGDDFFCHPNEVTAWRFMPTKPKPQEKP